MKATEIVSSIAKSDEATLALKVLLGLAEAPKEEVKKVVFKKTVVIELKVGDVIQIDSVKSAPVVVARVLIVDEDEDEYMVTLYGVSGKKVKTDLEVDSEETKSVTLLGNITKDEIKLAKKGTFTFKVEDLKEDIKKDVKNSNKRSKKGVKETEEANDGFKECEAILLSAEELEYGQAVQSLKQLKLAECKGVLKTLLSADDIDEINEAKDALLKKCVGWWGSGYFKEEQVIYLEDGDDSDDSDDSDGDSGDDDSDDDVEEMDERIAELLKIPNKSKKKLVKALRALAKEEDLHDGSLQEDDHEFFMSLDDASSSEIKDWIEEDFASYFGDDAADDYEDDKGDSKEEYEEDADLDDSDDEDEDPDARTAWKAITKLRKVADEDEYKEALEELEPLVQKLVNGRVSKMIPDQLKWRKSKSARGLQIDTFLKKITSSKSCKHLFSKGQPVVDEEDED